MQSSDLGDDERQKLIIYLAKRRDDLGQLQKRMEQAGWYRDNPTYQAVLSAWHSLHAAVNTIQPAARKVPLPFGTIPEKKSA
jgi:hypothetical protein